MFPLDESVKDQHQTAHEECLVLIKTLQITYICVSYCFCKIANFQTIKFLEKSISDKKTFGQEFLRKFDCPEVFGFKVLKY